MRYLLDRTNVGLYVIWQRQTDVSVAKLCPVHLSIHPSPPLPPPTCHLPFSKYNYGVGVVPGLAGDSVVI